MNTKIFLKYFSCFLGSQKLCKLKKQVLGSCEACWEPCQTSAKELFAEIVNGFELVNFFAKPFILDIWHVMNTPLIDVCNIKINLEIMQILASLLCEIFRSIPPEMFPKKLSRKYAANLQKNTHTEVWLKLLLSFITFCCFDHLFFFSLLTLFITILFSLE